MKTLSIEDQTYRRLTSVLHEIMTSKGKDVDYDYVLNHLIDTYQDSLAYSGENAGG